MADPLPYTSLSIHRYAKIMGINPVHFSSAYGDTIWPLNNNRCNDIWPRYTWQTAEQVSHQDLARAIQDAEDEMTRILGYSPAPVWVSREMHRYPQFYRPDMIDGGGRNVRSDAKSIKTRWGKVAEIGRRAVSLLDTATVAGGTLVYSDDDSDTFYETATITLPADTDNNCQYDAYFAGNGGSDEWKVRPARSKTVTAGGNLVLVYDSWLLVDPDLQGAFPTFDGFTAINVDTTSNFVTSVDVYREYTDSTLPSVNFYWEPTDCGVCPSCAVAIEDGGYILLENSSENTNCPACGLTTQTGCLFVRDVDGGIVVPQPADYIDGSGWQRRAYASDRDPTQVRLYYRAGAFDERFLRGVSCDPLSDYFANIIAMIATARLERPFCSCHNASALAEKWQTDLAFIGQDNNYSVDFGLLGNPLGTRFGEIMAWKRLSKLGDIAYEGFVL